MQRHTARGVMHLFALIWKVQHTHLPCVHLCLLHHRFLAGLGLMAVVPLFLASMGTLQALRNSSNLSADIGSSPLVIIWACLNEILVKLLLQASALFLISITFHTCAHHRHYQHVPLTSWPAYCIFSVLQGVFYVNQRKLLGLYFDASSGNTYL